MGVEAQTSPWRPVTRVIVALIACLLAPIVNRISRHPRIPRRLVTSLIYLRGVE